MVSQKNQKEGDSEESTARLAVLIDADNAQAAVIDGLFAEIARHALRLLVPGALSTGSTCRTPSPHTNSSFPFRRSSIPPSTRTGLGDSDRQTVLQLVARTATGEKPTVS